ncbi:MAG: VOC family protein [Alphaproteobacteria bacterium]|nr:VOC family protein [Alphaproteobacteria bacterium]
MAQPLEATGIDHVVLRCKDTARSRAFYQGILGMAVAHESDAYVFLRCGGQTLALFRADGGLPSAREELDHIALTVTGDFDATVDALAGHGLAVQTRANDPRCIYIEDPDGHRLQLLTDR